MAPPKHCVRMTVGKGKGRFSTKKAVEARERFVQRFATKRKQPEMAVGQETAEVNKKTAVNQEMEKQNSTEVPSKKRLVELVTSAKE